MLSAIDVWGSEMLLLVLASAAQVGVQPAPTNPAEIVVEKRRQLYCGFDPILGSRIRRVRRCADDVSASEAKLTELENERIIQNVISQGRLDHAASVR